jgi:hypothetical protein
VMWQFGPYQVERLIARGGMGEILRAYDTRHDRVVALKLLADHLATDQEFRERFRQEAHAAARLSDPHVVPIHAYGEIDGRLYLDMRLVEGSDAGSRLASGGPMHPADAVHVIEQVAQALDAAHNQGLVHRDVKPSNILIGNGGFAYLVDFGIAHSARSSAALTSSGYTIGTLDYMAPERFDDAPVDARADVYSLACVLYQCLTGAKPFAGDTAASLINAHLNHAPPIPSTSRPGIPGQFDQIITRGMAKNPSERFATAGELARAAQQALTSSIMVAAHAGPQTPQRRGLAARWGLLAAAVSVAGVAAIGAAALAVTQLGTEADRTVPAEPPAKAMPPGTPPPSQRPRPGPAKTCRPVIFEGVERGYGCFESVGDHLYAHDTVADGMWIRTDSATDYNRTDECKDLNSEDGPVDCKLNVSEKGRLRFQVELWNANKRITETGWTDYLPISQ